MHQCHRVGVRCVITAPLITYENTMYDTVPRCWHADAKTEHTARAGTHTNGRETNASASLIIDDSNLEDIPF